MHSSYPHSAPVNQQWALSWRALGWVALFTWPTAVWIAALFFALTLGPRHAAWTIAVLGTFSAVAGLLSYTALKRENWLRESSVGRFVPILGEVYRVHKLRARKRGNKYLAEVWKAIASSGKSLESYLYVQREAIEWYIPGHPAIGERSKVEQALSDALGVFERDFNFHHFEVTEAPGHRQQYIAHFFREAPIDPLRESVSFADLPSIPRADKPDSVVL